MNILTFTSLFPNNVWPHHGIFVKERMTHVARLGGCSVKVVAPVPYFPPLPVTQRARFRQVAHEEVIDGLDVYHPRYFMVPKVTMTSYGLTMFMSVAAAVRRLQRRFDFDVIDAHFAYPDGLAATFLGKLCRRPVIVSVRGSDVNAYRELPLIRRWLRYTLRRADGVIAVSSALKERIVELGVPSGKISVVANGVDVRKFYGGDRDEARRQLGLGGGRILLSVGGLVSAKGFDVLLEAVKILVEERRAADLGLVVVGDGPERPKLESRVRRLALERHVSFAGEIPHDELRLWYTAADLFCLASRREGCPNVVLEALACGTPVVASAVGGVPEIIDTETVGLLCEGAPRDLAATIHRALDRRWDRETIADWARARHAWEPAVRAVLAVFRSVVSGAESRRQPVGRGRTARVGVGAVAKAPWEGRDG